MKIVKRYCLLFSAILTIAFTAVFAPDVRAANFTVTTTADSVAGSLRQAVLNANATAADDTIDFAIPAGDAGCAAGVCTITLTGGELVINDAATAGTLLITNSTGASNLLISGNNASRVFSVNAGGNLTLNGLTVTWGQTGDGGGIYNFDGTITLINSTVTDNLSATGGGIYNVGGTVTLTNSTVSGNTTSSFGGGVYNGGGTIILTNSTLSGNKAISDGGGIYSNGTITLTGSTVSGNIANDDGGGIYNFGAITLTNSTVSGNTAAQGGGIYNFSGATTLTNSTVSGNSTQFGGGGIYQYSGTTTLTNSTVSGNIALFGGGIYTRGGTLNLTSATVAYNNATGGDGGGGIYNAFNPVNLRNTIVAKNTASSAPDFAGEVESTGTFNLIGDGAGMSGITNGAGGNQVGVDPLLNPTLALNGGATTNHALLFGSPAIDKGNSFAFTTDQRGLTRPSDNAFFANAVGGDGADIGAFEVQFAPTAANVTVSGRVTTASGRGIRSVQITMTGANGNKRTAQTTTFGYYQFDNVTAGETVTLSVKARQFRFEQSTIVRTTNDSISDGDFVSEQ